MTNLAILNTGDNTQPYGLFFETSEGWEILDAFSTMEEAEKALELEKKEY